MKSQIIQGDCYEELLKLEEESIDLVLTDPPYKLSQRYGTSVDADNLISVASIMKTIPEFSRVLKDGRYLVIFYDSRILPLMFEAIRGTDLRYQGQIFLYRRWGNAHKRFKWMYCTDPVLIFQKGESKPFRPKELGKVKHDCYTKSSPEKDSFGHPAQKPEEIIGDIIEAFTDERDVLLDGYAGTGTVHKKAIELKRECISVDNNPKYIKIIEGRIRTIKGSE